MQRVEKLSTCNLKSGVTVGPFSVYTVFCSSRIILPVETDLHREFPKATEDMKENQLKCEALPPPRREAQAKDAKVKHRRLGPSIN